MRCEPCLGSGFVAIPSRPCRTLCPDCQGSGLTYCCDEAGANPPNDYHSVRQEVMKSLSKTLARLASTSGIYAPIDIHGEDSPNDHGC